MSYTNEDLAVVPEDKRTWGTWNYAALWIAMSLCIPTYMYASSLIQGGMNWWQAILTVFLGNSIVLLPMVLNGRAGARYGIPFPIFARSSFGIRGANIPALLRAVVACGWFGIQTWIGGKSLYQMLRVWHPTIQAWYPSLKGLPQVFPAWLGLQTGPAITFIAFWLVNMLVIYLGIESIRKLLVFKAIFLSLAAGALVLWAIVAANGLGPILAQPSRFETAGQFFSFFVPALTAMVGFWATLSLNIPDFTRYARSQRAQVVGQMVGLPPSMTAFALVGVIVTSATTLVYGSAIWDPIELAGKFHSRLIVSAAMLAVAVSTLATNIAANIVSPANDFSHLWPARINFKRGGYITGMIGILILPWKLLSDPTGYIYTWLIAYSALLGPIGGIMIADYYVLRRERLHVDDLYRREGRYWYRSGFNLAAVIALFCGILPNVPGFLVKLIPEKIAELNIVPAWINSLYDYAWFVGFAISGAVYWLLAKLRTFPSSV